MNTCDSQELLDEFNKRYDSNIYNKSNTVDYLFVMKHFGKCNGFLKEILQTEGITPEEHLALRDLNKVRMF